MLSVSIFGSEARGDFYKDSDVDIFILVKENRPDIRNLGDMDKEGILF